MPPRKLTKQQNARIKHKQQSARENLSDENTFKGTIISHFGKTSLVEDKNQQLVKCKSRQNLPALVCGDHVIYQLNETGNEGVILALEPRHTELARPDRHGRKRIIAANIDQIMIVVSSKPELNERLVDRYLAAAELTGITPLIVFNKTDLLAPEQLKDYQQRMTLYAKLGYPVIYASCKQEQGLTELQQALSGNTSVFVGQSGVGKSSLVNLLLPHADAETGEVSDATGKGQHTTTVAYLYHLSHSTGKLIDSPGIREFALWEIDRSQLANGFREIAQHAEHCKYRNCMHLNEPGCAVREAVNNGEIAEQRLDSYKRILDSIEE